MGPIWFRLIFVTLLVLEGAVWNEGCWEEERVALLQFQKCVSTRGFRLLSVGRGEVQHHYSTSHSTLSRLWFVELSWILQCLFVLSLRRVEEFGSQLQWSSWLCRERRYITLCIFIFLCSLNLVYKIVFCPAGFEKLSKSRHLENLDLSYDRLNDGTLSSLSKISTLRFLNLGGNDLFTGSNQTDGKTITSCLYILLM